LDQLLGGAGDAQLNPVALMLEDLGHKVIEASSGEQALAILRREKSVDLVITDQAMPRMTGLQLIQKIEAEWPNMPVILATGYAELSLENELLHPKLAKPFLQYDVAQAVEKAMTTHAERRVIKFRPTRS
jgi:CheY-like chemotaxis protein